VCINRGRTFVKQPGSACQNDRGSSRPARPVNQHIIFSADSISSTPTLGAHVAFYTVGVWAHLWGYSSRGLKLTTYFHVKSNLAIRGAIPPLRHTFPCLGAEKTGTTYGLMRDFLS
jgi:hypothetical protein